MSGKKVCTVLMIVTMLVPMLAIHTTAVAQEGPVPQGWRPDAPPYALRGPHWVGTRDFQVPEGDNQFWITVWYPALNPEGNPEEITYYLSKEFITMLGFPEDTLLPVTGHALATAEPDVDNGPYPLVVFSPGLVMWRQSNVYLFEHLASQGFVVISIEHLGESLDEFWQGAYHRPTETMLTIQFADQLTAEGGDLAGVIDVDTLAIMGASSGGWTALVGGGAQMNLGGCPGNPDEAKELVWLADCLEFLPKQNEIAAMFGLETAPEGLWPQQYDPRVDAVVSIVPDGDIWGAEYQGVSTLVVPTMVITSSADSANIPIHAAFPIYEHLGSTHKSLLVFEGADHPLNGDSCDVMPWLVDIFDLYWLCSDPVWDKDRAHDLFDHFITAFLLATLKGDLDAAAALALDAVQFPGITYETTGF